MGTTLGWYREGGPIMLLIVLVGVAGLAVLVERFYVIVLRSKNNGRVFIERIIQLVRARQGGRRDQAVRQFHRGASRHGPADSAEPELATRTICKNVADGGVARRCCRS